MGISILLEPQYVQPVYNEIMLVMNSNVKDQPQFNYIVDISIDGVFSSQMKVYSNPDGYGVVDMHRHLENAVTFDLDINETRINSLQPKSFIKYTTELSEQYVRTLGYGNTADNGGLTRLVFGQPHYMEVGDKIDINDSPSIDGTYNVVSETSNTLTIDLPFGGIESGGDVTRTDGSPTIVPREGSFGDKFAFNGVLPWLDVPYWYDEAYVPGLGSYTLGGIIYQGDKLLTTLPLVSTVKLDDRIWVNWIHIGKNGAFGNVKVVTNRGEFFISNDHSTILDENVILSTGMGPWNLMNTTSSITENPNIAMLGLPMFDNNTTTYSVGIATDVLPSGEVDYSSDIYTFNIDRSCSKFENYKLMYMDTFGSFLTVNFELASTKKTKVKKTDYKKNYGSYNASTNTYGWNSSDRGKSRLDTTITDTYSISTNWVGEDVGQQVIELMESPEVYHLKEGPLKITNLLLEGGNSSYFIIGGKEGYTTVSPHGLSIGDNVTISNTGNFLLDGEKVVTQIISPTEFLTDTDNIIISYFMPTNALVKVTTTGEPTLLAINITTSSLEQKQKVNDKLFNYKLGFEYSFTNTVQRG